MKKLQRKLIIDLILILLFVTLLFASFTGYAYHEIAGLGAGLIVLIHLGLNSRWIRGIFKRNASKSPAQTVKIILNSAIAVSLVVSLVTGVLISVVLFPDLGISNRAFWVTLHNWSSYIAAGLMGVHILLHASYLKNGVRKIFSGDTGKRLKRRFAVTASILFLGVFAYGQYRNTANALESYKASSDTAGSSDTSASETAPQEIVTAEEPQQEEIIVSSDDTQITEPTVTLTEYLDGMTCTGCGKHCPLTNPRCGKGEVQASQAADEYAALYGQS